MRVSIVALALLFGTCSAARAALLASDSFSYGTGGLAGDNGGTGWSGAWTISGTGANVVTGSLAYTDTSAQVLPVSGNSVNLPGSNAGDFRSPTVAPVLGTVYFSFLANSSSSSSYFGFSLFNSSTSAENLFLGQANAQSVWGIDTKGNGVVNSSTSSTNTALLVYKVDFGTGTGNVTITEYNNPTLNGIEPAVASATATRTQFAWNQVRIQSGLSANFDELKIGTTYADVVVPEPSSCALVAIGALGVFARRRSALAR